ncbi:MAG: PTS sugar transporter subunit IIA [Erysipelotrichaceae bacterium]|nr:PTS sugar transporter subunit IIA [Erysipelotrichaceae bacterium]
MCDASRFYVDALDSDDGYEVIRFMADNLIKEGIVKESAYQGIVERENIASSVYGSFAFPHDIRLSAKETTLSIYISSKPLNFNNEQIRAIFLFTINAKNHLSTYRSALEAIYNNLEKKTFKKKVLNCKTIEAFTELIIANHSS